MTIDAWHSVVDEDRKKALRCNVFLHFGRLHRMSLAIAATTALQKMMAGYAYRDDVTRNPAI